METGQDQLVCSFLLNKMLLEIGKIAVSVYIVLKTEGDKPPNQLFGPTICLARDRENIKALQ